MSSSSSKQLDIPEYLHVIVNHQRLLTFVIFAINAFSNVYSSYYYLDVHIMM